jgi:hypothetical protein
LTQVIADGFVICLDSIPGIGLAAYLGVLAEK